MEEQVGQIWHRLVTWMANRRYPESGVALGEVAQTLGVVFRALGGDGGLQIEAADATASLARRSWVQRIAGSDQRVELAWRDERSLRLPSSIDWFPDPGLNRDLYFWLAALAAGDAGVRGAWLTKNQALTCATLERFPGLRARYLRLVAAHVELRPDLRRLHGADHAREAAVRRALEQPGSVETLPPGRYEPAPVPLWLHPAPPLPGASRGGGDEENNDERRGELRRIEGRKRRQAERVSTPEEKGGLVTIRMENIFTWGEFVHIDRGVEDDEDLDRARALADDLDRLSVARNRRAAAARLKFDLDLPAESEDDLVLSDGILLPEWDWKRRSLQPDHCRVVPMIAAQTSPTPLPVHLRRTAKRLRSQFQALAPARTWHRGRPDGQEIDVDAYLRYASDRAAGCRRAADGLYKEMRSGARDLACLLLADLSLSTDTWVNDRDRVIDVIRDSLFLFAESLAATGDRFAIYGFSSRKRNPVRLHTLKVFSEGYDGRVRGRIASIKPGYYTRMGAAIRYATGLLSEEGAGRRLLLLLTDGKPNDLDKYEGRYGVEDTRHAVAQARRQGLHPFCVTIDEKGNDYLPRLFGTGGYVVVRNPEELPKRLPLLYARLTAS